VLSVEPQGSTAPTVVSIGYDPGQLAAGGANEAVTFPRAPSREDLEPMLEGLRGALARSEHALVIYPAWLAEPALRRLQTIHAVLGAERIAVHRSALPPLAGGVLCELAGALGERLGSTGELVGALPALERRLIVAAWAGTVTRLRDPAPSILQHLLSLWPGTAFGVVHQPERRVHRLSKRQPSFPIARVPEPMRLVVAPREGANLDWVTTTLNPALGDLELRRVDPTHHGPRWWGTSALVEAVAHPTDLDALAASLTGERPLRACGWCGEPVAAWPCPVCGHRQGAGPSAGTPPQRPPSS